MMPGMEKRPQLPRVIFAVVALSGVGLAILHFVHNGTIGTLIIIGLIVLAARLWETPGMRWP
jgi:hypothetical protein